MKRTAAINILIIVAFLISCLQFYGRWRYDLNRDGRLDRQDEAIMKTALYPEKKPYESRLDMNRDRKITLTDYVIHKRGINDHKITSEGGQK